MAVMNSDIHKSEISTTSAIDGCYKIEQIYKEGTFGVIYRGMFNIYSKNFIYLFFFFSLLKNKTMTNRHRHLEKYTYSCKKRKGCIWH